MLKAGLLIFLYCGISTFTKNKRVTTPSSDVKIIIKCMSMFHVLFLGWIWIHSVNWRCIFFFTGFDNVLTPYDCDSVITYPKCLILRCVFVVSYDALCGPCCYFEETPERLTTGCQSPLSVILFFLTLGTVIAVLRSVKGRWKVQITIITVNVFGCLDECLNIFNLSVTVQLNGVYLFLAILLWLKAIFPGSIVAEETLKYSNWEDSEDDPK